MLKDLPHKSALIASLFRISIETINLDLSLLKSSPPEEVKLSKSNKRFTETLREYNDVVSPVKRYAERMIRFYET